MKRKTASEDKNNKPNKKPASKAQVPTNFLSLSRELRQKILCQSFSPSISLGEEKHYTFLCFKQDQDYASEQCCMWENERIEDWWLNMMYVDEGIWDDLEYVMKRLQQDVDDMLAEGCRDSRLVFISE